MSESEPPATVVYRGRQFSSLQEALDWRAAEDAKQSSVRSCPRCGKGQLVRRALDQPAEYSCGHQDYSADLLETRPMEFGFTCKLCSHRESWNDATACSLAGKRHLFEEHQIGLLPLEHPEDHGRRLAAWESQL